MAAPIEEVELKSLYDELLLQNIEDELNQPITDPFKESTVDYYLKKKDKVMLTSIHGFQFLSELKSWNMVKSTCQG